MKDSSVGIVFLGAPGAGKGTQAQMIAQHYRIPHISTGDILRAAVASGSSLGEQVKAVLDRGDLVSDETVTALVRERLSQKDCEAGYLLDGYPRTVPQAVALDALCIDLQRCQPITLLLEVPQQELVSRLKARGVASGRSDDDESVVQNRLKVYDEKTAPLIEFYAAKARLKRVNGLGSVDEIFGRLKAVLD